jgi:nonsense-mediated mRNA decay protein 3
MAACLRKIPGLNKVKLVDSVWIWTEPHSMRIKLKITVQKEVMNGTILQQAIVIEFVIRNQQCKDCEKSYTEAGWHAVVQIRQRVSHKRTFYYLEQLLLKYKAHSEAINIVVFKDGMDFYFMDRQHAMRFIDFLTCHIPIKTKLSRKLVSADHTSNQANFKNNYIVEIVPICKDDLLVLPKELAKNLANISPLVLVKSVGADIHVVDPMTGEVTYCLRLLCSKLTKNHAER